MAEKNHRIRIKKNCFKVSNDRARVITNRFERSCGYQPQYGVERFRNNQDETGTRPLHRSCGLNEGTIRLSVGNRIRRFIRLVVKGRCSIPKSWCAGIHGELAIASCKLTKRRDQLSPISDFGSRVMDLVTNPNA